MLTMHVSCITDESPSSGFSHFFMACHILLHIMVKKKKKKIGYKYKNKTLQLNFANQCSVVPWAYTERGNKQKEAPIIELHGHLL